MANYLYVKKKWFDAFQVTVLGLILFMLGTPLKAFERLHEITLSHEEYDLDELVIALSSAGFGSLIFFSPEPELPQ